MLKRKGIERENEKGIFVIGMKVKRNGWESNHVFRDSHEVGRFRKEEIGEVKTVRVTREVL